ncbi:hypothetical protein [Mesorhizobium xinjiangense]|uniref:hypothetical protein n=1 Tax=Mesorhizobium xinjiangense TaxID=2678685 RepID=UPI002E266B8F
MTGSAMTEDDDKRTGEARRILERLQAESDPSSTLTARAAKKARNHLTAADADRNDSVELWGTRIGRVLGLVVFVGLLVWLLFLLAEGQL